LSRFRSPARNREPVPMSNNPPGRRPVWIVLIWLWLLCPGGLYGADLAEARKALANNRYEAALGHLLPLAEVGQADAQALLAGLYLKGAGVPKDNRTAMAWLCRLAHQQAGGATVMHGIWFLAEYFRTGGGVPGAQYNHGSRRDENPLKAYFWFTLLAHQQQYFDTVHADSQRLGNLGRAETGRQLQDEEKAALDEVARLWRPRWQAVNGLLSCLDLPGPLP